MARFFLQTSLSPFRVTSSNARCSSPVGVTTHIFHAIFKTSFLGPEENASFVLSHLNQMDLVLEAVFALTTTVGLDERCFQGCNNLYRGFAKKVGQLHRCGSERLGLRMDFHHANSYPVGDYSGKEMCKLNLRNSFHSFTVYSLGYRRLAFQREAYSRCSTRFLIMRTLSL